MKPDFYEQSGYGKKSNMLIPEWQLDSNQISVPPHITATKA